MKRQFLGCTSLAYLVSTVYQPNIRASLRGYSIRSGKIGLNWYDERDQSYGLAQPTPPHKHTQIEIVFKKRGKKRKKTSWAYRWIVICYNWTRKTRNDTLYRGYCNGSHSWEFHWSGPRSRSPYSTLLFPSRNGKTCQTERWKYWRCDAGTVSKRGPARPSDGDHETHCVWDDMSSANFV